MTRRTLVAGLVAVSLCQPAGAGTPLWAETYAAMPGTITVVDSEASGTVVAVVSGGTVVVSKDAGLTWVPLSPLSSPPNGSSSQTRVSPASATTWFAANGSAVSATLDGGASWRRLELPRVVRPPAESMEFATEVGAADGTRTAAVGWHGARIVDGCPHTFRFTPIYVTHDGGARWRRSDLPVSGHVGSVTWFDGRRAAVVVNEFDMPAPTREGAECRSWAYLARGSVWTTADGGATWRAAYRSSGPSLVAAAWSSATTLAVVDEAVGVARTTVSADGGRTFGRLQPLYDNKGVNGFPSVQFTAGRRGWVGAILAGVFRSDTAGAEWTHEASPVDGSIYGVPELTAIDRDSAVHGGPRALVTRVGEAPVTGPIAAPPAGVPDVATVTNAAGGVSSTLTLPVRGLPTLTWRVAASR